MKNFDCHTNFVIRSQKILISTYWMCCPLLDNGKNVIPMAKRIFLRKKITLEITSTDDTKWPV